MEIYNQHPYIYIYIIYTHTHEKYKIYTLHCYNFVKVRKNLRRHLSLISKHLHTWWWSLRTEYMTHTEDIITWWLCFMVGWIPLSFSKFPLKDGSRIAAHDKMTHITTCCFPQTIGSSILVFCFPVLIQDF